MSTPQAISNRLFSAPSAASGVIITPNASAWANSAWVTLIASASADLVLTGLSIIADTLGSYASFEIDVATGAAASEVVVTTVKAVFVRTYYTGPGYVPFVVPLDNIASGARVSVRMRKSSTSTSTWAVSASYYKKPLTGTLLTTAKPQKCVPSAAEATALTLGAVNWGNSTWTQLVASTATDIIITGLVPYVSEFSNDEWEIGLGIGAAGFEVEVLTVRIAVASLGGGGFNLISLFNPFDGIVAGTRIAARTRGENVAFRGARLSFMYIEKPL